MLFNLNSFLEKFVLIYSFISFFWFLLILDIVVLNFWLFFNVCEYESRVMYFGGVLWGISRVIGFDCENGYVDLLKWISVSFIWKEGVDISDYVIIFRYIYYRMDLGVIFWRASFFS